MQASGKKSLKFLDTMSILRREEGLLRFWKGAQVIASGCIPAHAAYFTSYELLKQKFHYKNEKYDFITTGIIGALTTFTHDFFITPADVIKQRLQLCNNLNMMDVMRQLK